MNFTKYYPLADNEVLRVKDVEFFGVAILLLQRILPDGRKFVVREYLMHQALTNWALMAYWFDFIKARMEEALNSDLAQR